MFIFLCRLKINHIMELHIVCLFFYTGDPTCEHHSCAETVLGVGPCGPFSPRSLHCPPDRHAHTCLTREICRKGVVTYICPKNQCVLLSRNGLLL